MLKERQEKEKLEKEEYMRFTAYIPDFIEKNFSDLNLDQDKSKVFEKLFEDFVLNDLPLLNKIFGDIGELNGRTLVFRNKEIFNEFRNIEKKTNLWTSKSELIRFVFYMKIIERLKYVKK